jgi:hypothetical protein
LLKAVTALLISVREVAVAPGEPENRRLLTDGSPIADPELNENEEVVTTPLERMLAAKTPLVLKSTVFAPAR